MTASGRPRAAGAALVLCSEAVLFSEGQLSEVASNNTEREWLLTFGSGAAEYNCDGAAEYSCDGDAERYS